MDRLAVSAISNAEGGLANLAKRSSTVLHTKSEVSSSGWFHFSQIPAHMRSRPVRAARAAGLVSTDQSGRQMPCLISPVIADGMWVSHSPGWVDKGQNHKSRIHSSRR